MSSTPLYSVLYQAPGPKTQRRIRIATAISLCFIAAVLGYVLYRFYEAGQFDARYWHFFTQFTTWSFLAQGLFGTLQIALTAGVLCAALSFVLMLGKLSRSTLLRAVATLLINFTRGVPTLLFIYFFFLILPPLGISLPSLLTISLPVALSACGVVAELLRSGVNSIERGQTEAALSLGLSRHQTFFIIVFPQALRRTIPALIAELVIVVKDSTFAYIVSFPDLMQNSKVLISNYDALLPTYMLAGVIYILINYGLNYLSIAIANRKKDAAIRSA